MLGEKKAKFSPINLLSKFTSEYPIPVRRNVDFIRELPNITIKKSFVMINHPEILERFSDIIGGEYQMTKDGIIHYIPSKGKKIKLTIIESSSSVRSLLDIGFYLRHIAKKGDIIIIDEPELNQHPENQRKIARLFSMLIKIGINIFITTHSDYIIKELNTLIMLNQKTDSLTAIAKNEGYCEKELLSSENIKVYIAKDDMVLIDGNQKRTTCPTLIPANIDQKFGIELESFDSTIDEMNRIQEEIIWGTGHE